MNVDAISWSARDALVLVENFEPKCELINGLKVFASVCLKYTSHETVREEEAAQPVARWVAMAQPIPHEFHSNLQVFDPGSERFQRRVGDLLPVWWDLIFHQS